jgi:hypothetical protein
MPADDSKDGSNPIEATMRQQSRILLQYWKGGTIRRPRLFHLTSFQARSLVDTSEVSSSNCADMLPRACQQRPVSTRLWHWHTPIAILITSLFCCLGFPGFPISWQAKTRRERDCIRNEGWHRGTGVVMSSVPLWQCLSPTLTFTHGCLATKDGGL